MLTRFARIAIAIGAATALTTAIGAPVCLHATDGTTIAGAFWYVNAGGDSKSTAYLRASEMGFRPTITDVQELRDVTVTSVSAPQGITVKIDKATFVPAFKTLDRGEQAAAPMALVNLVFKVEAKSFVTPGQYPIQVALHDTADAFDHTISVVLDVR
jgi:hypothetical protein